MKQPVLIVAFVLALWGPPALAQYKVVGPDGKVTFTDRVPDANQGRVSNVTNRGAEVPTAELPFELRQVVQKFPVTIHTTSDCDPCKQGRELLVRRGVPFQERTATTQDDLAAWQKTNGTSAAPILFVGKQKLERFNVETWNQTLELAGYPAVSKLPINYRHAQAMPLAPPRQATAQAANATPRGEAEVAPSPPGAGGIRF